MRVLGLCLWLIFSSACGLLEKPPAGMVLVGGGGFLMGTDAVDKDNRALALGLPKPWFADESPQHRVDLPDFYIDRFEVTNRQYYIFCQATDHRPPRSWGGMKYPEGQDNLPVTSVSFFDAAAYAEWADKRLPSEAEWEKTARGPDGFQYPWGNEFDPGAANISAAVTMKPGRLAPVGSFPQGVSYYGAYDMIGNAWEWVWDYYRPYPGNTYKSEDYGRKYVVVRGLSYVGVGHFLEADYKSVVALKARASYREKLNPFAREKDVGFRCAKDKIPWYKNLGRRFGDSRTP